jgi:hypothetical protein
MRSKYCTRCTCVVRVVREAGGYVGYNVHVVLVVEDTTGNAGIVHYVHVVLF